MAREPFDAERIAMFLLGALVLCGVFVVLMITINCTLLHPMESSCSAGGNNIREWLTDTIPVLIAIIMRGGRPPSPPPKPSGD
jgi:hypothetical protein